MSKIIRDKLREKLEEYDYTIYDIKKYDDIGEYAFFVDDMLIVTKEEDTKNIGVAFQATTRPDVSATHILILNEIEEIKDIHIMESFIFTDKKTMVCGEDAYELIMESEKNKVLNGYIKEMTELAILKEGKCFNC